MQHLEPIHGQAPAVNTIPPEILSTIFLELRQIRRYRQLLPFQVTISHVCQHWREIAVSTPQLWSTITLFSARSFPCVDEWLTRSGATPLDVRLDLYDADYRENVDAIWIKKTLARIASHAHRFQNLFLFTYREVNAYHALQLFERAEAPLLERLNICVGRHGRAQELNPFVSGNDFILPTTFNGGLPRLAFAELNILRCMPSLISVTSLHLNLVGHTRLLHFDRLAEILQAPQNLVTLSIRGSVGEHSWPIHHDRPFIQLPKLRNLELSGRGATGVRFILFFGAPNLESLRWHVDSDSYHRLLDSPQFQPGMNKFPALKYLTVVDATLTLNYLGILMQIFPTSTHVLCSHPAVPERSFRNLQSLGGKQGWRDLRVFAFQGISGRQIRYFAREIETIISARPNIHKILVDQELLSRMGGKPRPAGAELAALDLLSSDTFPDYWWNSGKEYTPERL